MFQYLRVNLSGNFCCSDDSKSLNVIANSKAIQFYLTNAKLSKTIKSVFEDMDIKFQIWPS